MSDQDFVTVLATNDPRRFLVVVMKWHARDEEYIQGKVSEPLTLGPARALASSWAAALGLETRGELVDKGQGTIEAIGIGGKVYENDPRTGKPWTVEGANSFEPEGVSMETADHLLRSMFDVGSELAAKISHELDTVPSPAAFHALAVLVSGLIMSFDGQVSEGEKHGLSLLDDAARIKQFTEHVTELLPIMRESVKRDGGGPKVQ